MDILLPKLPMALPCQLPVLGCEPLVPLLLMEFRRLKLLISCFIEFLASLNDVCLTRYMTFSIFCSSSILSLLSFSISSIS